MKLEQMGSGPINTKHTCTSPSAILKIWFDWDNTIEGYDFWHDIYLKLKQNETSEEYANKC